MILGKQLTSQRIEVTKEMALTLIEHTDRHTNLHLIGLLMPALYILNVLLYTFPTVLYVIFPLHHGLQRAVVDEGKHVET